VRGSVDDSDSNDGEEEDSCAPLIGENPEHNVDMGYDFETFNGLSDTPPEFQLEIQLDMSIVPDYVGLLETHGDAVSFTTNITGVTLLVETPIREEEDAVAAATSTGSSESSPARDLPTEITQAETVIPVSSITHRQSSYVGSPRNRLEESFNE